MAKTEINIGGGGVFYLINLFYAFIYWGFWHGILNLFIPYALAWDIVKWIGAYLHG